MAVLHKHNCDNSIKESILTTLFGNHYPDGKVILKDSNIHIQIVEDDEGCLYHTKLHKDIPFNDIYISGMNEVGMIFQVRHIPDNFKIHNHTSNQIFIKEIITTDLKGDLILENMYLDLLENMNWENMGTNNLNNIPSILSKRLEKVTSIDFGENGGLFIRCFDDLAENSYKTELFNRILKDYYASFKQHLNHLPHIQLVINVAAVGKVVIYLDFEDMSKCHFI